MRKCTHQEAMRHRILQFVRSIIKKLFVRLPQFICNMTRKNIASASESKTASTPAITSLGSGLNEDLRLVWMAQYICTCFPDIPDGKCKAFLLFEM